ncbi:MAG: tetratricopeptide repeat protein [Deltaproteobacteria bacterium]|nr:MAG: tetratricopeptide repeat protein [Deltaproteobacteria bacterium]
MYPDERVAGFVTEHFLPARIHVREQKADWDRYAARFGVHWTPTVLVVDPSGTERHRIEGFLPVEEFLAQLVLGLGRSAFARQQFGEAERRLREVVERFPGTAAAPEALYWAGVARYKATNDATALGTTADAFARQYQDSVWAKKASVWRK